MECEGRRSQFHVRSAPACADCNRRSVFSRRTSAIRAARCKCQSENQCHRPFRSGYTGTNPNGTRTEASANLADGDLSNPVAAVGYFLDDHKKVAHRMLLPPTPPLSAPSPAGSRAIIEKFGSQEIEGVRADGTRTMFPAPGGTGRVLTVEQWESPDLKITLLTKSSNGYRDWLTKLRRTEPDPALFRPPSDYTVVDEKGPFPMTVRFHYL